MNILFFNKCNVVGVSLGFKDKNGFSTNIQSIRVFVRRKVPCDKLLSKDIIPKEFKGIPVDVVQSGVFKANRLDTKVRPTIGGYSIGNFLGFSAGTLGCLVYDSNYTYILSCCHVVYLDYAGIGSAIIQPGSGRSVDTVASLYKYIKIKPETFFRSPTNYVDCAICRLNDVKFGSPEIAFVGRPKSPIPPTLNLSVQKVGFVTELTKGKITDINVTMRVNLQGKTALFKKQIVTTKMTTCGDSGALLIYENNHAPGLLMSSGENNSTFNTISNVLKELNVSIVT